MEPCIALALPRLLRAQRNPMLAAMQLPAHTRCVRR